MFSQKDVHVSGKTRTSFLIEVIRFFSVDYFPNSSTKSHTRMSCRYFCMKTEVPP